MHVGLSVSQQGRSEIEKLYSAMKRYELVVRR